MIRIENNSRLLESLPKLRTEIVTPNSYASSSTVNLSLDPKTSAVSLSSGSLKLPSLCSYIWLGVAVRNTRSWTKVLHGFTSILWSPKENLSMDQR